MRRLDDEAMLTDPVLASTDPDLDSVRNLNEPADYAQARSLPTPEIEMQPFGRDRQLRLAAGDRVGFMVADAGG